MLTKFSLEQLLALPCMRTEGEMAEMVGSHLIRENIGCYIFGPFHATTTLEHPIKVRKSRGL
jgi:hypothetical protein